ncbi:hypothetical protein NPIL_128681 [Nephila pilipes]|uniref:Uncharacterized protein n=1 Tax=Nephila pilipes TaxID=299642 RepID=A0A8X6PBM6_NEPPI|nr:hypothetical protein NPIL_128681 [Nephila pilipes]
MNQSSCKKSRGWGIRMDLSDTRDTGLSWNISPDQPLMPGIETNCQSLQPPIDYYELFFMRAANKIRDQLKPVGKLILLEFFFPFTFRRWSAFLDAFCGTGS